MDQTTGFLRALCVVWLFVPATSHAVDDPLLGVVVEDVASGSAASRAGILPGDLLLSWSRTDSQTSTDPEAGGWFRSAFEPGEVEIEQAPRGRIEISGSRQGKSLELTLPPGEWQLTVRPRWLGEDLQRYQKGLKLQTSGDSERGTALWRELGTSWRDGGEHRRASWLWFRMAKLHADRRQWQSAEAAFQEALVDAAADGDELIAAAIHESLAKAFGQQQLLDEAADRLRRALAIRRRLAPESLAVARDLNSLGIVAWRSGDPSLAQSYFERALALRYELAPGSLDVAASLNNLGLLAGDQGDLAAAEDYYRRALQGKEKLTPDDPTLIGTLANLGFILRRRGHLVASEDCFQRALAIYEKLGQPDVKGAYVFNNLANTAFDRDDFSTAETYYRRALALLEEVAPEALQLIMPVIKNLGYVAAEQGRLDEAESYLQRSLDTNENPEALMGLGLVARKRGDSQTAEKHHLRVLELLQKAPRSLLAAQNLQHLGQIAADRGDLTTAEERHRQALAIREKQAPGSAAEAESCYELGRLYHQARRLDQALAFYDRALTALESQHRRFGGSDEDRAGFAARYASYYRDVLELLVELGQLERAFHVLERYRSRSFLRLLGERDLVFSADIPPDLDRQRRLANARYDQIFRQLFTARNDAHSDDLRQRLQEARRQQDEVAARIRVVSPRLAALEYPQPLNLSASQAALDSGTLLLSYFVGDDRSFLFAVGPAEGELQVFHLETDERALGSDIERFREALRRGRIDRRTQKIHLYARQLSEHLLAPVADQIARAERLLFVADGPLHSLPFAALTDPTATEDHRYLIESKPLYMAPSATVFAWLRQQRGRQAAPQSAPRLAAFGDPHYPATDPPQTPMAPPLRSALGGDFRLPPLPSTRDEVEALRELYPQSSDIFLGAAASEERAKAVGKEVNLFHFACHGFLDDRAPLESGLALSIPPSWRHGEENGLLQAWEIFEQVRIDADLVTLSACDTGSGKIFSGEGLLGLSRAFQYAGARSVLASLWSVGDRSTSELMRRFYGHLKKGESQAVALHRAQIEILRDSDFAHPFHWAGFALNGDWR